MTRDGTPPPDIELLARLDADRADGQQAADRIRAAADADPAAAAVLAALAATRAQLAAQPEPPIPPGATERWAAALRAEANPPNQYSAQPAAVRPSDVPPDGTRPDSTPPDSTPPDGTPLDGAPPRNAPPDHGAAADAAAGTIELDRDPADTTPSARPGAQVMPPRPIRRRALAAAAAALLVALAAGLLWPRPAPAPAPPAHRIDLAATGRSALGETDLGPLADPVRRAGCLRALGVLGLDPDARPLGGRRVQLARGPGLLLVFATGELGVFDVVVVDPDCGPAGGRLLGTARIGQ